ncbi:hypothetical protein NPIL_542731 [Nephila pilipes]|uniref:Uncharacterized protein n=1 Tax=Nephila pilipes TaxID=299642 RepID=A0A8X6N3T6_NEPPI|nr:hypothetical protein NPIL_542731 [Nephila pilipes]
MTTDFMRGFSDQRSNHALNTEPWSSEFEEKVTDLLKYRSWCILKSKREPDTKGRRLLSEGKCIAGIFQHCTLVLDLPMRSLLLIKDAYYTYKRVTKVLHVHVLLREKLQ